MRHFRFIIVGLVRLRRDTAGTQQKRTAGQHCAYPGLPDTQPAAPSALLDWFHLHPFLGHPISSIKICDRENPLRTSSCEVRQTIRYQEMPAG
jgi:hypothetical protein